MAEFPTSALGHVAQCVSKGRLALFVDNRTKVRLAKEAQEAARLAIKVDPYYDVAHHLMGRSGISTSTKSATWGWCSWPALASIPTLVKPSTGWISEPGTNSIMHKMPSSVLNLQ